MIMDADGSNVRDLGSSLSDGGGYFNCAAWSPNSAMIAVTRRHPQVKAPGNSELYIIQADSTRITKLASGDAFYSASWSPSGSMILYSSSLYTDGGPYDFAVNIVRLDGSSVQRTSQPWTGADWGPDGQFAYICGALSVRQICIKKFDDTKAIAITDPTIRVGSVDWSPDGKRIAFGCDQGICSISPDGSDSHILAASRSFSPVWSPDSKVIVYRCAPNTSSPSYTLCLMNGDGSGNRTLVALPGDNEAPSFSPLQ
jgi:Tol biopolymer transport system component